MYTNECPNIFVQTKLIRTNVRIIMCAQYIQISEYIGHRLVTLCSKVSSKKGINWKFSKHSQSQNVMSVYQVFFCAKIILSFFLLSHDVFHHEKTFTVGRRRNHSQLLKHVLQEWGGDIWSISDGNFMASFQCLSPPPWIKFPSEL